MTSMTNLTVISHSCVLPDNQRVWAEVARRADLALTLVAPAFWRSSLHGPLQFAALPALTGRTHPIRVYHPGRLHLHTYSDLGPQLTAHLPDVVYLDEDAHSLAAAQILSLQAIMDFRLVITLKQNLLKRYPFPFGWVERRSYRLAHAAAATSAECLEVARQKGYQGPAEIVHYPIDTERFAPRAAGRREAGEPLQVGYAGRLVPEKGVTDLMAAVALAQREVRLRLSIVGTGPQAQEVSRLAAESFLGQSFILWDRLPTEHMPEWYRSLDVLVLPSRTTAGWKEQFGRVLGEAMASGVPVVGSSSGFIPEFIESTGGGVVYPEGDVEALAAALVGLAQEEERRQELGSAGREGVTRLYGLPVVADRLANLVLSVR